MKRRVLSLLILTVALIHLVGCASERYARPSEGTIQRGLASWYGPKFHGRPTANGETYDMHGLTAAHRELPLGTKILVKNLDNGRSLEVRVNDRGPYIRGRVLDLSYGAALALDMADVGLARVEIRVLAVGAGRSGPHRATRYSLQVGAFRDLENARSTQTKLAGFEGVELQTENGWHRVRVGLFTSREEAEEMLRKLRREGFEAAIVSSD